MKKYLCIILSTSAIFFNSCKEKELKINDEIDQDSISIPIQSNNDSLSKTDTLVVVEEKDSTASSSSPKKETNPNPQKNKVTQQKTSKKIEKQEPINKVNVEENVVSNESKEEDSNKQIYEKAIIYPGCDNEALKGNEFAIACFIKLINRDLQNELDFIGLELYDKGYSGTISSRLFFVINTDGKIVNITSEGDEYLGKAGIKALRRISNRQTVRNTTIKPALDVNNNPVLIRYNAPLKVVINE